MSRVLLVPDLFGTVVEGGGWPAWGDGVVGGARLAVSDAVYGAWSRRAWVETVPYAVRADVQGTVIGLQQALAARMSSVDPVHGLVAHGAGGLLAWLAVIDGDPRLAARLRHAVPRLVLVACPWWGDTRLRELELAVAEGTPVPGLPEGWAPASAVLGAASSRAPLRPCGLAVRVQDRYRAMAAPTSPPEVHLVFGVGHEVDDGTGERPAPGDGRVPVRAAGQAGPWRGHDAGREGLTALPRVHVWSRLAAHGELLHDEACARDLWQLCEGGLPDDLEPGWLDVAPVAALLAAAPSGVERLCGVDLRPDPVHAPIQWCVTHGGLLRARHPRVLLVHAGDDLDPAVGLADRRAGGEGASRVETLAGWRGEDPSHQLAVWHGTDDTWVAVGLPPLADTTWHDLQERLADGLRALAGGSDAPVSVSVALPAASWDHLGPRDAVSALAWAIDRVRGEASPVQVRDVEILEPLRAVARALGREVHALTANLRHGRVRAAPFVGARWLEAAEGGRRATLDLPDRGARWDSVRVEAGAQDGASLVFERDEGRASVRRDTAAVSAETLVADVRGRLQLEHAAAVRRAVPPGVLELVAHRPARWVIPSSLADVPWELLGEPKGTPPAALHGMVRQLSGVEGRAATLAPPGRALVIANPAGPQRLRGAGEEGRQVAARLTELGYDVRVLSGGGVFAEDVFDALADGPYEVVHIAAHGTTNADTAEMCGVVLQLRDAPDGANAARLTGADLAALSPLPRLLFVNACDLGALGGAFAEPVLRAGLPMLLMAPWPVHDEIGAVLATSLYAAMVDHGAPFGRAVQMARHRARARAVEVGEPVGWAVFQAWGDPDARLRPGRPPRAPRRHSDRASLLDTVHDAVVQLRAQPHAAALREPFDDLRRVDHEVSTTPALWGDARVLTALARAYAELVAPTVEQLLFAGDDRALEVARTAQERALALLRHASRPDAGPGAGAARELLASLQLRAVDPQDPSDPLGTTFEQLWSLVLPRGVDAAMALFAGRDHAAAVRALAGVRGATPGRLGGLASAYRRRARSLDVASPSFRRASLERAAICDRAALERIGGASGATPAPTAPVHPLGRLVAVTLARGDREDEAAALCARFTDRLDAASASTRADPGVRVACADAAVYAAVLDPAMEAEAEDAIRATLRAGLTLAESDRFVCHLEWLSVMLGTEPRRELASRLADAARAAVLKAC